MHRDVAPAQNLHAALVGDDLEHAHGKSALQSLLRQEEHSDAVVALAAQLYAGFLRRCLEKLVRDLRQDADAVTDLSGGVLAGPVLQFLHDVQRVVQNLVVLPSVNIYNASDAAGIVFLLVPHFSAFLDHDLWGSFSTSVYKPPQRSIK